MPGATATVLRARYAVSRLPTRSHRPDVDEIEGALVEVVGADVVAEDLEVRQEDCTQVVGLEVASRLSCKSQTA